MADTEQAQMDAAEKARTTRAHGLASDIADLAKDLQQRLEEAYEVVSPPDLLELIREHCDTSADGAGAIAYQAWASMYPTAAMAKGSPLERVIGRLFDEAPKLEDASGRPDRGQRPAIPHVQLTLRAGVSVEGALSTTPEGTLKLGFTTEAKMPAGNVQKLMIEQFFEAQEVACISVPRELPRITASPIIVTRS